MKKNTINTINNKCKETEILNDMIMNEYRMNPRLWEELGNLLSKETNHNTPSATELDIFSLHAVYCQFS